MSDIAHLQYYMRIKIYDVSYWLTDRTSGANRTSGADRTSGVMFYL